MSSYTTAQAKRDFQNGYLTNYHIQRAIVSTNWTVYFKVAGNGSGYLVDTRNKEPRQFKTLDAVVAALEDIGFRVEGLMRM